MQVRIPTRSNAQATIIPSSGFHPCKTNQTIVKSVMKSPEKNSTSSKKYSNTAFTVLRSPPGSSIHPCKTTNLRSYRMPIMVWLMYYHSKRMGNRIKMERWMPRMTSKTYSLLGVPPIQDPKMRTDMIYWTKKHKILAEARKKATKTRTNKQSQWNWLKTDKMSICFRAMYN